VSTDSVQAMVQDFETKLPLFEGYVDKMKELVAELLEENCFKYESCIMCSLKGLMKLTLKV